MKTNPALSALNAVSPLDGRYASRCEPLRPLLSEAGFMAHRVEVELAWLVGLSEAGLAELKPLSATARARWQAIQSLRLQANLSTLRVPLKTSTIPHTP